MDNNQTIKSLSKNLGQFSESNIAFLVLKYGLIKVKTNECGKPFPLAALFEREAAKTRIQKFDWLAKMFSASKMNGFLLFSLFARRKSPSRKRALDVTSIVTSILNFSFRSYQAQLYLSCFLKRACGHVKHVKDLNTEFFS